MTENVDFTKMKECYRLIGSVTRFCNCLHTKGNAYLSDLSWKQYYLIVILNLFDYAPTINELSAAVGTTHQNTKQLLLKLQRNGFVKISLDKFDKRKQRIILCDKVKNCKERYKSENIELVEELFSGISDNDLAATLSTLVALEKKLTEIKV